MSDTQEETPGGEAARRLLGHELATALDDAWRSIQANHPDVPDVVLFVSPTRGEGDTKRFQKLGHFGAERWQRPGAGPDDKPLGEVLVTAEQLNRGALCLLETLLHEGAHAMCHARGQKDTSQHGRYHNGIFKRAAMELGLTVAPMGGRGLAHTELADGTAEQYDATVVALGQALVVYNRQRPTEEPEPPRRGGPVKAVCGCDPARIMRISPSVLLAAPIVCKACDTAFHVEAGEEDADS
jgi:hypothetical protein